MTINEMTDPKLLHVTTLPNGVRVVVDHRSHAPSAAIDLACLVGRRHETESQHGLAHFLEHMLAEGTSTRSKDEIIPVIEETPARWDLFTSLGRTHFRIAGLPEETLNLFPILSDTFKNSTFPEDRLEVERQVIIEEHARTMSDGSLYYLTDYEMGSILSGHSAVSQTDTETLENIRKFKRSDLLDFKYRHYVGANLVVFYSGPADPGRIVDLAYHELGDIEKGQSSKFADSISFSRGNKKILHSEHPSQIVDILFPANTEDVDRHHITMNMFCLDRHLKKSLRESEGVYVTSTELKSYPGFSYVRVRFEISPDKIISTSEKACEDIRNFGSVLKEEEIETCRKHIKLEDVTSPQTPMDRIENITNYFATTNQFFSPERESSLIQQTTRDQILESHRRIFSGLPSISSRGPSKNIPSPQQIQSLITGCPVPRQNRLNRWFRGPAR